MAVYTLPDLDYDYGALAPHIAPEIMELHHSKHHAAYVAGANTALDQLAEARESGNFAAINKLEKDLAFHLGGHINHSVFWKNMSPDGGGEPTGDLACAIDEFFGSFEAFKKQFAANANAIQGSGWSMPKLFSIFRTFCPVPCLFRWLTFTLTEFTFLPIEIILCQ